MPVRVKIEEICSGRFPVAPQLPSKPFLRKNVGLFVANKPINYIQIGLFHSFCTVPVFGSTAGRVIPVVK